MVEFDRLKAQCRADIDHNLLRGIQSDWGRLNAKLKLLEGEMDGAQKVINQKQHQIDVALQNAEELRVKLEYLAGQACELAGNPDRWQTHKAS
jgi:hypothetical protein